MQLSQVTNYTELNAFVFARGTEMAIKADRDNDLVYMEALRADAKRVFEATIEIIENRYDYLTWYAFMVYINRISLLIPLDKSGDLAKCIDLFASMDGQAYFEETVKPLYNTPIEVIKEGQAASLAMIDEVIGEMRVRRSA